ncbi:hypothetical protein H4CHR_01542 [Variovorax sp. PBS-H4]|uniref:hypothetical protein n=1 Tax=Variovorax sp. PBS-H4 TaxID=434008 RepID=UPI001318632D|nr:hypothetical protein [Variovorax sp. PBS-H4]VTU25176.1 hypothetical protein H4CHR_01542 [Variovorax sp. PBS-H4]
MSEVKQVHPSQAHWPDEHNEVVKCAVRALRKWPAELESGRMFYMGERVTREEFERVAKAEGRA